jgi:Tol biopolymer transport system component
MEKGEQMAKTKHLGMLAVAAGMLAAVGMLVLMTLEVKAQPARDLPVPEPFQYALVYDVQGCSEGLCTTRNKFIADFTERCRLPTTGKDVICGGIQRNQWRLPFSGTTEALNAAWSPDGSKIAFQCKPSPVGTFGNDYEICTINGNMYKHPNYRQQFTRLTDNTWHDGDPTWSPDGSRIAFTSNRDGNYEIYTMKSNGTGGSQRFTNNPGPDTSPDWSPSGRTIAFTSFRSPPLEGAPGFDIYTMRTNGTRLTQLTSRPNPQCPCQLNDWPSWSPSGEKIAFSSDRSGIETNDFEIYTMNTNGTGLEQHTFNPYLDIEPTWSPDGRKIVFVSNRELILPGERRTHLYWTFSNGKVTSRLIGTRDFARAPDWNPNPPNY